MVKSTVLSVITHKYNEFVPLSARVKEFVESCGVSEGIVYVISQHTTGGITVNERLECVEDDILKILGEIAPEDGTYYHARFLREYGAMAGNPTGHIKAMLTGNHGVFSLHNSALALGAAQEIYFAEFDGPQEREICITVIGEAGE